MACNFSFRVEHHQKNFRGLAKWMQPDRISKDNVPVKCCLNQEQYQFGGHKRGDKCDRKLNYSITCLGRPSRLWHKLTARRLLRGFSRG